MCNTHGRSVLCALVFLVVLGFAASTAVAQHTPCMPGEFLKNSCPPGPIMGAPGTTVTVPIAKICPKNATMWMTVTCPPPGCLTWSHSHRPRRVCRISSPFRPILGPGRVDEDVDATVNSDTEEFVLDIDAFDSDATCDVDTVPIFASSFKDEKQVGSRFINESDAPASYIFRAMAKAELKPNEAHSFKVVNVNAALQMIENPSDVDTGIKGDQVFTETLSLRAGESNRDRFFNLDGGALLVLENKGKERVELKISVVNRDLPEAEFGALATGYSEIGLAPGWDQGPLSMHDFVRMPDSRLPASPGGSIGEPKEVTVALEGGETFSKELIDVKSGDLSIEYVNVSGSESNVEKQIIVTHDRVMAAGESSMLLCVDAGNMVEHMVTESARLVNTMVLVRLVHDQPPGTDWLTDTKGFPDVDMETEAISGTILAKAKCWRIMFSTGYTLHYLPNSTVELDGGITVPPGAMSGQTFQAWFTVNAMAGAWNQTLSCHPTVVVP